MDMMDRENVGPEALAALLKSARERVGYTFRAAAAASGTSEAWWRGVERGRFSPSPEAICRAAGAVGVEPKTALRTAGIDPETVTIVEVPPGAELERSLLMAVVGNPQLPEEDLRRIRRLVAAYLEADHEPTDTAPDHVADQ